MSDWNAFKKGSLPEINKLVLVFAEDAIPAMQTAKWTGEGPLWMTSVRGQPGYFEGSVTFWAQLPETPTET